MFGFRGGLLVVLWARFLVYHTSANLYDATLVGDVNNLDDNYSDTGPLSTISEDQMKDLLLQKIIYSLVNYYGSKISQIPYGPKWDTDKQSNQTLDSDLLAIIKRVPPQETGEKAPPKVYRPIVKPPRKWQNRKGKPLGSHVVCYFKLCAFRRPAK